MSWRKDFRWSWRGVVYKETGANIRFSRVLFYDIYRWAIYTAVEKARNIGRRRRIIVISYPNTIRPWYLLWAIITRADGKIIAQSTGKTGPIGIQFLDHTQTIPLQSGAHIKTINFDCTDISKSKVNQVFKDVFGYNISVDPKKHHGPMVAKSDENGTHDGQIVNGPENPRKGLVYQKVIDNRSEGNHVADFRCPTLFGQPLLVFIKERPVGKRFDNLNTKCRIAAPETLFSPGELEKISQFCQKMRLDFGGIDILRDNNDGQIYIVDVNKTDMGPPLALPLKEKLRATDIMAKQFRAKVFEIKR